MKILKMGDPAKAPHIGQWRCPCDEEIELDAADFKLVSQVRGDKLWRIVGCETCGQDSAWERIRE